MKSVFLLLISTLVGQWALANSDFQGAVPHPQGEVSQEGLGQQLQIEFPKMMNKADAFKVSCSPAIDGYQSWGNNNQIWTYNFKFQNNYGWGYVEGGTICKVEQVEDLTSVDGTRWPKGTINYQVQVEGPLTESARPVTGFNGFLRGKEPVLMFRFTGEVDKAAFFQGQNVYLTYLSGNAPSEKIPLEPLSQAAEQEIV
ncbi:MAG: hypothetical protein KDD22_08690, partial [Bdellovibrionales bacterium]|nr:hypothetical protein [Bdellovibrionales bacterium]